MGEASRISEQYFGRITRAAAAKIVFLAALATGLTTLPRAAWPSPVKPSSSKAASVPSSDSPSSFAATKPSSGPATVEASVPQGRPLASAPSTGLKVSLEFEGNLVLPNELYMSVLTLARAATSTQTASRLRNGKNPDAVATFIETQLLAFLRTSGYLLATVVAKPQSSGVIKITIDEGRLDRIIVVGEGAVRTLQIQLNLDLPQNVFNRFLVDRQLAELVRERGLVEARYQVVPMEKVDHAGIQLVPTELLGGDKPLAPGSPHELRISIMQLPWRVGFGYGIGFQSPDGFFVSGNYRSASVFLDDDRWFSELQVAARSFEAIFSSNKQVGVSRVESINRWFGPPLFTSAVRPTFEIDLRLLSRFRSDLQIESYLFAPLSASLDISIEPLQGMAIIIGGGVQYRSLFDVQPQDNAMLQVLTEERTVRGFAEIEFLWNFEPNKLRQDRQDNLRLQASYFSGSGGNFDSFARILGQYDLSFSYGYDEIWFEVDGALLLEDVPFYDEVALGDGFVRVGYTGDFFTRKAASLSAEYRLSLTRDAFKISFFNDVAVFEELDANRSSVGAQVANSLGMGLHFLILNTFQFNFYAGVGFVPKLDPLPGVSLQVKQAF
ncbi:MAG: hypothetical protein AAF449_07050 [Myxococcota bacterium]